MQYDRIIGSITSVLGRPGRILQSALKDKLGKDQRCKGHGWEHSSLGNDQRSSKGKPYFHHRCGNRLIKRDLIKVASWDWKESCEFRKQQMTFWVKNINTASTQSKKARLDSEEYPACGTAILKQWELYFKSWLGYGSFWRPGSEFSC